MHKDPFEYPQVRLLEPFLTEHEGQRMISLRDPGGLSPYIITLSPTAYFIVTFFDGHHSLTDIQKAVTEESGQFLPQEKLREIISQLDQALFLESPRFREHLDQQVRAYQDTAARPTREATTFGCGEQPLDEYLEKLLTTPTLDKTLEQNGERLVGIVAPHLDYPRGGPCYGPAYELLRRHVTAERFVILGTNHFGRSASAVATTKDFETPFGTVRTDRDFLQRLSDACETDLCHNEFDHLREHSVELQAVCLKHAFRDREIRIVPILCPDPCGPTGTAPANGDGVDLTDLAAALRKLIDQDPVPTCVIAGADLSHVGANFGDERHLNEPFLAEVEESDRHCLSKLTDGGPADFVSAIGQKNNPTRICSAGCLYTLAQTFPDADAHVLAYHQAVDQQTQTCVTCMAAAFFAPAQG